LPATPAGGLYSTAADMTRFFQALASGKLLRPETVRTFTAQQVESAPAKGDLPALHYGFGFGTGRYENHAWFGHNGGAPGLNAEAVMFPDDGLIVVVLANRDPPVASQVFRSVRDALLKDSAGGCR
jgi:CubicO group peptidase (beta-lactamase class C family)